MSSQVYVDITEPIATVRLDQADRHRIFDGDGWRGLATAFDELSSQPGVACVVVCGAGGRAFAAGPDLGPASVDERDATGGCSDMLVRALRAVRGCVHPTVAIVEGICVGGGLEIAACCDLRVCGESARFGAPIHGLGAVASHEDLQPLAQLLGASPVLQTLWSGEIIGAERASKFGLVNRVYPDVSVVARGYGLAARIAAGAPLVNRWHKRLMRRLHARVPLEEAGPSGVRSERRLRAH